MIDMELIKKLQQIKDENGYTLHDLSKRIDIQVSTLERWLKTGHINKIYAKVIREKLGIVDVKRSQINLLGNGNALLPHMPNFLASSMEIHRSIPRLCTTIVSCANTEPAGSFKISAKCSSSISILFEV